MSGRLSLRPSARRHSVVFRGAASDVSEPSTQSVLRYGGRSVQIATYCCSPADMTGSDGADREDNESRRYYAACSTHSPNSAWYPHVMGTAIRKFSNAVFNHRVGYPADSIAFGTYREEDQCHSSRHNPRR